MVSQNIKPAATTTTTTGAALDTAGYESVTAIVDFGTITDGTHTISLQESDTTTSGDFADAATTSLLGSFTAGTSSADETSYAVGYKGGKRYVRVKNTTSGTITTGGIVGATIVLSHARHNDPGTSQV